jgi:hypothetical protein
MEDSGAADAGQPPLQLQVKSQEMYRDSMSRRLVSLHILYHCLTTRTTLTHVCVWLRGEIVHQEPA